MAGILSANQILVILNGFFLLPAALLGILGVYAFFRLIGTISRRQGV